MKFQTKIHPPIVYDIGDINDLYVFNDVVKPEEIKKEEVKRKPPQVLINPVIKEDDSPFEESPEVLDPPISETVLDPNSIPPVVDEPTDVEPVDFILIEEVPVFPGCERKKGREAQSKCMSEKITKLIQRKFDTDLANELGLSGMQKIHVQFTISKSGEVTAIKTRAPHPLLAKEAERVVDLIPDMKPGKQRDKEVPVRYFLPINFQVHN
jgi:protein TonB